MPDSGPTPAPSLALLTDLYELTMAAAYWRSGKADDEAVFHLFFRRNPFRGGFTLAAGLAPAAEALDRFRFGGGDLAYLAGLRDAEGQPLFPDPFLRYLEDLRLSCDVDAVPEGTVVFPGEPLVRVNGPLLQAQLLESLLLNIVNFQALVATKAARIVLAAKGDPVLEFGLRRAQGIDGALAASRAAYVGGCAATSNVLAGRLFGIPVRGTHAHSWVMSFDSEPEAFEAYADALPGNAVFLVDTYDTLAGVRHAVDAGRRLRERGHELLGIRLDSGDLAALSIEARRMLDEAGFPDAVISASNDLDEGIIASLKEQGARISVWGVGTRLVTAFDEPALGGVYKLSALRRRGQTTWTHKVKLSEQAIKVSTPGIQQVRRYETGGTFVADSIYDEENPPQGDTTIIDPLDTTKRRTFAAGSPSSELLVPIFREGRRVHAPPPLGEVRAYAQRQLACLPAGVKRFLNPHLYPVGLEKGLHELKTRLVLEARGIA